ncbi:MAG: TonB-linked SusC/RagA family outer membrane protein [Bacteroidia bacterium]|jgi:TonB-linked SusC/RagA family outer membrane protein
MKKNILKAIIMLSKRFLQIFIVQTLFMSLAVANEGNSQKVSINDVYINLDLRGAKLLDVFNEIEARSNFKFAYEERDLSEKALFTFNSDESIHKILTKVSKKTALNFRRLNDVIDVSKASDGPSKKVIQSVQEFFVDVDISGKITDENNEGLPGASVVIKGTAIGTTTDMEGNYKLSVPEGSILFISFVGYTGQEVTVGNQSVIDLQMAEDAKQLDEIVVIGYGTTKKINLTGAVSVVDAEMLEDRPVANVQQALQGLVPNLTITTSGATGEPGAGMAMNIRGLASFSGGSNSPLVLVDNIPMDINDIDPNDIENITVLKDAASAAIYGARAAYGVILITTQSGSRGSKKARFTYSSNVGLGYIMNQPENAGHMDFALTLNESAGNAGKQPWYNAEQLGRLEQNIANPGSAPEINPRADRLGWDYRGEGFGAAAVTDWNSIFYRDNTNREKHNLSVSGGSENINYYVSGGLYKEKGIVRHGNEQFNRYNLSATVSAKATDWMDISLITKYKVQEEDFPNHPSLGRNFIYILMTRIKPTKPAFFPGTDVWTGRIGQMQTHRDRAIRRQLVLSPRITLKPLKGWTINLDYNYRTNDDRQQFTFPLVESAIPGVNPGDPTIITKGTQENSQYRPNMASNKYVSPNVYSNYTLDVGKHNFNVLAGYQQESYTYFNMSASTTYVLTDAIPSLNTGVGNKVVQDEIGHWSIRSLFGRFKYSYADKYLFEANVRRDGSSRFETNERFGVFPSLSAGWVFSNEDFYPLEGIVDVLKFRASYGAIGNQNVDNYLYVPTLPVNQSRWLFGGEQQWTVGTPNFGSVDLTWEQVNTFDLGLDIAAMDDRLAVTFDWYTSKTNNLIGPGIALPAVLGTAVPQQNEGEITTKGWEVEVSWRNRTENGLSYEIRGVLSDNKSTVTKYNNPTKILSTFYEGQQLGEIWGMKSGGLYQTEAEIAENPVDQSFIFGGTWNTGDQKYLDLNGDGLINIGDNTADNSGDKVVIGNDLPRFQFGLNANASWKGFDVSILFQGVAKRDLDIRGLGTFRGPANGPLHATVYTEHMDFFRDDTSPLGANPDAYFPRPYDQYIGQNGKNYNYVTDRYMQNGAYIRLKNMQIGYTIPKSITDKIKITNLRVYISGENLWTGTSLRIFDPESFNGRYSRVGDQYPLTKIFSTGITVNF